MEKNNELVESLNNLCDAFHNVLNVIESNDSYLNVICNEYPFDLSFDEMMHEVMSWRDAVKEVVEKKSTRDTYFSLEECTEEELLQLKGEIFDNLEDNADLLSEEDINYVNGLVYYEDVPFEILEKVYGHISFVDEDFWCNI